MKKDFETVTDKDIINEYGRIIYSSYSLTDFNVGKKEKMIKGSKIPDYI